MPVEPEAPCLQRLSQLTVPGILGNSRPTLNLTVEWGYMNEEPSRDGMFQVQMEIHALGMCDPENCEFCVIAVLYPSAFKPRGRVNIPPTSGADPIGGC